MTPRRPRRSTHLAFTAIIVASAALLGACATTVEESEPTAATVPEWSVAPLPDDSDELLVELSDEMRHLSEQIANDNGSDDERATLERIDAIWAAARADVESTNPELINGIDTAIDMTHTAVTRRRPADADKATQLLADLIERRG